MPGINLINEHNIHFYFTGETSCKIAERIGKELDSKFDIVMG